MNSNLAISIRMASASVATLISCVVLPLLAQGNQKLRSVPVIAGAIILTCSGWLYAGLKIRLAGIIHAVLMLGIGGYSLAIGLPFLLGPHGMADNPAAGAIALANLQGLFSASPLLFPADTYSIFSYADQAHAFALGFQPNVGGAFTIARQVSLPTVWPPDTAAPPYSAHVWHSAEFRSDYAQRCLFWDEVLVQMGLKKNL